MQWPALIVLAILLALVHTAASRGRAIKRSGAEVFPSSLLLRAIYAVGSLSFLVLGLGFVYKLGWREMGWFSLIFFGFPFAAIINWPATILVTEEGVQRTQPFRKTINIPRNEILAVVFDRKKLTTSVCGVNSTIVHGNYNVASEDFRRLLSRWRTIEEQ